MDSVAVDAIAMDAAAEALTAVRTSLFGRMHIP